MYRMYRSPRAFDAVQFLIIINIIVFLITAFSQRLFYLFALEPALLSRHPWTLLTAMFVHAGIGHIFGNMLTLYFFGGFLSQLIGERRFLLVYFTGGIIGNIFYVLLALPFTIAVGASGAIFAVGGALAVMRPKLKVFIFPIPAPIPLWLAITLGFFLLSFFPNVAWQAHLGGLLFGLTMGYFFRRKEGRLF